MRVLKVAGTLGVLEGSGKKRSRMGVGVSGKRKIEWGGRSAVRACVRTLLGTWEWGWDSELERSRWKEISVERIQVLGQL